MTVCIVNDFDESASLIAIVWPTCKEKKLLCTGTNIKLLLLPGLHIVADTRNGHHSDVSFPHDRTHQHEFALDPPFVKNQINQRFIERWILLLIGLSLLWTGVAGPAGGAAEGRGAPPS